MKNFTYKQALVIGILLVAIGYPLSRKVDLGNWLAVIGDVFIAASIVMLIMSRKKPS
jgi:hypothetical protein